MATGYKFNDFVLQQNKGVHDFSSHTFKIMLCNTAPVATNSVKADLTEIAAGNGYTAGGTAVGGVTASRVAGVTTVYGNKVAFTASAGSVGPFRYAVLYNNSATNKNLVGYWDYESAITLAAGETFEWRPSDQDSGGAIFTDQ